MAPESLSAEALSGLKARLEEELAALDTHDRMTEADRAPVELDQQSVGRLSRMDAMQLQAMADAAERRREQRRRILLAALTRIADGSYGDCMSCGEPIPIRRLNLDPAVAVCIACLRG